LSNEYPGQEVTLAGFSFGSRAGMEVGMNDEHVVRLISIGTPVDKYEDYDFLLRVRKPILFIHGDRDEFGELGNLRRLVERVPGAELVVIEDSGHFFDEHLDKPRETVREWTTRQIQANNG
jgi:alpha/beta superfamily hydrolase